MVKPKLAEREKERAKIRKTYEDAIATLGKTGRFSPHDKKALRAACALIADRDSGTGSVVQGFAMGLLTTSILGKGEVAKDAGRLHDNLPRVIDTLQRFVDRRTPIPKKMRPLCALYVRAWCNFGESMNKAYDAFIDGTRRMAELGRSPT